jgi:hypothetical protein
MDSFDDDLMIKIRNGYFICINCESLMDLNDDDQLVCKTCGHTINHDDYDYEEYFEECDEDVPYGCAACGGPYPQCKTSCKLFDD